MSTPFDNGNENYNTSEIDKTEIKDEVQSYMGLEPPPTMRSVGMMSSAGAPGIFGAEINRSVDTGIFGGEMDSTMWGEPSQQEAQQTQHFKLAPSEFNPTKNQFNQFISPISDMPLPMQEMRPRTLDPTPIYFEKYSSFTSTSNPQDLLKDIATSFDAATNVDHECSLEKNKIKGVVYGTPGRCTFKVRLFSAQRPDEVLCEFQRRSGCVVSFNKFYRRTLVNIPKHVNVQQKGQAPQSTWLANSDRLEQLASEEPAVQLDTDTAANLIAMAGCENVDVQREGAQALASIARHVCNQEKLAEAELQERVVLLVEKLISSDDVELCRSGCVLLCSLTQTQNMQLQLRLGNLTKSMARVMDGPSSFERIDSKRQVARAVLALSKNCTTSLQPLVALIEKHSQCSDNLLSGICSDALISLKA